MNWRIFSASTLVAASVLIPMSSYAAPLKDGSRMYNSQRVTQYQRNNNGRFDNQGKRQGEGWQRMQQELNLSPRQIKRIQEIRRNSGQDRQSTRQQIWAVLTPQQRRRMEEFRKQRQYNRGNNFNGNNNGKRF